MKQKMTPKYVQSNIFRMFSSLNMIRAKLEPYEYVKEHSIHVLFSQWSKKYWEGTLHEPAAVDSLRKVMKTVMNVMIMKKNKVLSRFDKLNVSHFICNSFSVNCFEYHSLFYPVSVVNKLRFSWFQQ